MRKIFLVPAFLLSLVWTAVAQPLDDDLPQITGCIALINAKVVSAPGKSPAVSTIIIRDGLITQVGSDLKVPADAYRIQADSLYAYPAFIDAFSSIGIKEPEREGNQNPPGPGNRNQRPEVDAEGNPGLEDAGITPYKNVRATFDVKEKSISDWRAQGFAIAHVVPRGKMIPGQGSVIVLSGKTADQLLWKENISMYGQWTGSGGAYPSTVIGIMAKWRELYHNASQSIAHQSSYENATLVSRPVYNQAHEALLPVVRKEMPLYFRAPKVKDISRAMALQEDLGMNMIIADAEEAGFLKDEFKLKKMPLILSLDLPEDKSEEKAKDASAEKATASKEAEGAKEAQGAEGDSSSMSADTVMVDPEKEAFEKRRAESLKAHREQAGMLAKEGIAFSFGTMSGKTGDFSKTMRTLMDNGLSADQALSALTTEPAELLGIEKHCGTLESGKMANVILSTKPLFDKDAAIPYMIVEGNLYEYEIKEKKKAGEKPSDASFSLLQGTWSYTIDVPEDKKEGTVEFTDGHSEIKGIITSPDITSGNDQLENIVIDGNSVSFTYDLDMGGQMVIVEFDLKLDGETFKGTVTVGEAGSFPIAGNRIAKPN